jgi:hypothetical protein
MSKWNKVARTTHATTDATTNTTRTLVRSGRAINITLLLFQRVKHSQSANPTMTQNRRTAEPLTRFGKLKC